MMMMMMMIYDDEMMMVYDVCVSNEKSNVVTSGEI